MRRAVTFAVRGGKVVPIFNVMTPIDQQRKWIHRIKAEGYTCDHIEFWTSDGTVEKIKVIQPAPKLKVTR